MKKLILTGIMLLMVLGVSGCRNNNDEANSIKVGYFNNVTHAQALLMKSEKSLENTFGKDINVKWTAFNAGPAEVEALFEISISVTLGLYPQLVRMLSLMVMCRFSLAQQKVVLF